MKDLGKWPRLLVTGDRVTDEQANEILIRTNSRMLCINDKAWEKRALETLGIPGLIYGGGDGWGERFREHEAAWDRLGNLSLQYLCNSQIASSWIGGPHGWCDWNGWIFCHQHNIGKWPSHDEVTEEWTKIAQAFPYLRLRSQLIADEGEGELAGTWDVADGGVTYQDGVAELVTPPQEISENRMLATVLLGMEQGVSPERLKQAVAYLTSQLEAAQKP